MYEIHKGVPIPEVSKRRPRKYNKYPFADMQVGDCIFVERPDDFYVAGCPVVRSAHFYGQRHKKVFTVRMLEDKIGVWRMA